MTNPSKGFKSKPITHKFVVGEDDYKCAECGNPRALHPDDGFVSTYRDKPAKMDEVRPWKAAGGRV